MKQVALSQTRALTAVVLLSLLLLKVAEAKGNGSVTVHITKTGAKYHSAGCRYLSRSDYSISLEDAVARGYEPCSVCDPPVLGGGADGGNYDIRKWDNEPEATSLPAPPPPIADIKGYQLSGSTWLLRQRTSELSLSKFTRWQSDDWEIYEYVGRQLQFNESPARGNVRLYSLGGYVLGIELDVSLTERGFGNFRDYYSSKMYGLDPETTDAVIAWADNDGDTLSVTDEGVLGTSILYTAAGYTLPELTPLFDTEQHAAETTDPNQSRTTQGPSDLLGTTFTVVDVVDGDTIKVSDGFDTITVRLIGVDTPETVDLRSQVQAYGHEASVFLGNLLKGEDVWLSYGEQRYDKYSRTLAYVWRYPDRLFVNAEIVRQGYGHAYTTYPFDYMQEFLEYERKARANERGLWSTQEYLSITDPTRDDEADAESEQEPVPIAQPGHSERYVRPDDGAPKTVHVRGYYRKDGTYVHPHNRRAPRRRH